MSNNKQSMKLYTEEQLRDFIDRNGCIVESDLDEKQLTPIELPYTEIEYLSNHPEVLSLDYIDGFMDGAWWVKDKIQGGNNDERGS